MNKKIIMRLSALLMTAFLMLSIGMQAFALSPSTGDVIYINTNTTAKQGGTGAEYKHGGYAIDLLTTRDGYGGTPNYTPQYNGKTYVYCIEHTATFNTTKYDIELLDDSPYWRSLSDDAQQGITYTSIYGFPAATPTQLDVYTVDDAYSATQVIMWEFRATRS